ncbi:MAG: phosphosulfolactate synthase [Flavobacteriales bacterium]
MNVKIPYIPERTSKPRQHGLTMMMDKGLSIREAEDFMETSLPYVDLIKLGFGTSVISNKLKEKVKLYQDAGLKVYLGGTLFEAFLVRNKLNDYIKFAKSLNLDTAEVSDGSVILDHGFKCELIQKLSKEFTVVSEVGSKEAGILIAPGRWISMMQAELAAGSWKVIAEARESGNVGIYRPNGTAHVTLVNKILSKVRSENIIWEAPIKSQQAWFIKNLGHNVNLGNIAYDDVIPLETLRLGLRGDTFFDHLPEGAKTIIKDNIKV